MGDVGVSCWGGGVGDLGSVPQAMKILVTGGAGFIGQHVCWNLIEQNHDVTILDLTRAYGTIWCDVRNIESEPCQGFDCIVHLAAKTSVPDSFSDPLETESVNVGGTIAVLEAARKAGVKRVVIASSSSAGLAISPYGASKRAVENYAAIYRETYGMEVICLRYFNVYGPGARKGVIFKFMEAMYHDAPVVIYGDGGQDRDFTYVDDIVKATVMACSVNLDEINPFYEVGSGAPCSVNELAHLVHIISGIKFESIYHESPRIGDIRHSQSSYWSWLPTYAPSITLVEGLGKTWDWYKSDAHLRQPIETL